MHQIAKFLSGGKSRRRQTYDFTIAAAAGDCYFRAMDETPPRNENSAVLCIGIVSQGRREATRCRLDGSKPSDSLVQVHSLKSVQTGGLLDPDDQLATVVDDREQIVAIFDEQDSPPHSSVTTSSGSQASGSIFQHQRPPPNSGDGTSASSAGTTSPDLYPGGGHVTGGGGHMTLSHDYPMNEDFLIKRTDGPGGAGGLIRDGQNPVGTFVNHHFDAAQSLRDSGRRFYGAGGIYGSGQLTNGSSPGSMRVAARPVAQETGLGGSAASPFHLLTISQLDNGNGGMTSSSPGGQRRANKLAKMRPSSDGGVDRDHTVEIVDFSRQPPNAGLLVVKSHIDDFSLPSSQNNSSSTANISCLKRPHQEELNSSNHLLPTQQNERLPHGFNGSRQNNSASPLLSSSNRTVAANKSGAAPGGTGQSKHVRMSVSPPDTVGMVAVDEPSAGHSNDTTYDFSGSLPHGFSQFQRNSARKSRFTDKWLDAAERAEESYWNQNEDVMITDDSQLVQSNAENQSQQSVVEVLYFTLAFEPGRPFGLIAVPDFDPGSGLFRGLLITHIEPESRVARDGRIQTADRLVEVNRRLLTAMPPSEAQNFLATAAASGPITLQVIRSHVTPSRSVPSPVFPDNSATSAAMTSSSMVAANKPAGILKPPPSLSLLAPVCASTPEGSQDAAGKRRRQASIDASEAGPSSSFDTTYLSGMKTSISCPATPGAGLADTLQRANTRKIGRKMTIVLSKGADGLGFTVTSRDVTAGPDCPIYVKNILPNGAAIVDGRLKAGDRILEIDGVEVTGKTHEEVVRLLRNVKEGTSVELVISRQDSVISTGSPQLPRHISDEITDMLDASVKPTTPAALRQKKLLTFDIPLSYTGSAGLAISVKGATKKNQDGSVENLGIFVRSILHGGAAFNDGRLKINDQLIAINDDQLLGYSNEEAIAKLRIIMPSIGASASSVKLSVLRVFDANGLPVAASPQSSLGDSPVPKDAQLAAATQTVTFGDDVNAIRRKLFNGALLPGSPATTSVCRALTPVTLSLSTGEGPKGAVVPHYSIPGRGDYAIVVKAPSVNVPSRSQIEIVQDDAPPPAVPPRSSASLDPLLPGGGVEGGRGTPQAARVASSRSADTISNGVGQAADNYEDIMELDARVHGSKSEPAISEDLCDGSDQFVRDAPGRQSMSEKRKGAAKLDPKQTQTYQRIKGVKHERLPSAPTVLDGFSSYSKLSSPFFLKSYAASGNNRATILSGDGSPLLRKVDVSSELNPDEGSNSIGLRRSISLESVSATKALSAAAAALHDTPMIHELAAQAPPSKPSPGGHQKQRPLSHFFHVGASKSSNKVGRNRPTNDSFKRAIDKTYAANGRHLTADQLNVLAANLEQQQQQNGGYHCSPGAKREAGVDVGNHVILPNGHVTPGQASPASKDLQKLFAQRAASPGRDKAVPEKQKGESTASLFKKLFLRDKRGSEGKGGVGRKDVRNSLMVMDHVTSSSSINQPDHQAPPVPPHLSASYQPVPIAFANSASTSLQQQQLARKESYEEENRRIREEKEKFKRMQESQQAKARLNSSVDVFVENNGSANEVWSRHPPPKNSPATISWASSGGPQAPRGVSPKRSAEQQPHPMSNGRHHSQDRVIYSCPPPQQQANRPQGPPPPPPPHGVGHLHQAHRQHQQQPAGPIWQSHQAPPPVYQGRKDYEEGYLLTSTTGVPQCASYDCNLYRSLQRPSRQTPPNGDFSQLRSQDPWASSSFRQPRPGDSRSGQPDSAPRRAIPHSLTESGLSASPQATRKTHSNDPGQPRSASLTRTQANGNGPDFPYNGNSSHANQSPIQCGRQHSPAAGHVDPRSFSSSKPPAAPHASPQNRRTDSELHQVAGFSDTTTPPRRPATTVQPPPAGTFNGRAPDGGVAGSSPRRFRTPVPPDAVPGANGLFISASPKHQRGISHDAGSSSSDYEKYLREHRRSKPLQQLENGHLRSSQPQHQKFRPASNFVDYSTASIPANRVGNLVKALDSVAERNRQPQNMPPGHRNPARAHHAASVLVELDYPPLPPPDYPPPPIPDRRQGVTLPVPDRHHHHQPQEQSEIISCHDTSSGNNNGDYDYVVARHWRTHGNPFEQPGQGHVINHHERFHSIDSAGSRPVVGPKPVPKKIATNNILKPVAYMPSEKLPSKVQTYEFHQKTTVYSKDAMKQNGRLIDSHY